MTKTRMPKVKIRRLRTQTKRIQRTQTKEYKSIDEATKAGIWSLSNTYYPPSLRPVPISFLEWGSWRRWGRQTWRMGNHGQGIRLMGRTKLLKLLCSKRHCRTGRRFATGWNNCSCWRSFGWQDLKWIIFFTSHVENNIEETRTKSSINQNIWKTKKTRADDTRKRSSKSTRKHSNTNQEDIRGEEQKTGSNPGGSLWYHVNNSSRSKECQYIHIKQLNYTAAVRLQYIGM